jgi:hypothetical protein
VPSGNALFLVCVPCEKANEADYGVRLAERTKIGWYEPSAPSREFSAWLSKHRRCAGSNHPDHFMLAHLKDRDHDQMPDVRPVVAAMQLDS